jgi:iron complex outermembrane receptor protein
MAGPGLALAAEGPVEVEEVIVTAQKRSENLQTVPISITALNAETLEKAGVTSLDSIQRLAPGLTMSTVGSGFVSYTYLRGSGTNQIDSGSDPSVAFFVDEVYIAGVAGLQFDLFDVERIEVLKGPQGTLFGRNAAAGAISIVTKRPSADLGGTATLDIGDYGAVSARASVTGPLVADGSMRFRLSAGLKVRDAFTESLSSADDPGDLNSLGARGQLEFIGEDATFLLSADVLRARNGMTNQFLASASKAAFLTPAATAALPAGERFYAHYYDVDGHEDQDAYSVTGRLEWNTPLGQLTSISAFRLNRFDRLQDQDGTIADSYVLASNQKDRTFSQELRLSGGDRLRWLAGLYLFDAETRRQDTVTTGPDFAVPVLQNLVSVDRSVISVRSYAAFGQLTYALTDTLSLTAGGRFTRDEKEDDRFVKRFTAPAFSVTPKAEWDSFDPAVTLNWQATPLVMLYASYRRGFKSGGFQTLLPISALVAGTPFDPEQVDSYEAGVKSEWFDRRLRANLSVFRADVVNQQILRVGPAALLVIDNAGHTRTDGVDIALAAFPSTGLRLDAAMTFQKARFKEYMNGAISYAGKSQLRSPDFTGSFSAEYRFDLGDVGDLTVRGEYNVQSTVYFENTNSELRGLHQPTFGLFNARIAYSPPSAGWGVAVWGRNLGGEEYFRNVAVAAVTGLAVPGDPRTFGISLTVDF